MRHLHALLGRGGGGCWKRRDRSAPDNQKPTIREASTAGTLLTVAPLVADLLMLQATPDLFSVEQSISCWRALLPWGSKYLDATYFGA